MIRNLLAIVQPITRLAVLACALPSCVAHLARPADPPTADSPVAGRWGLAVGAAAISPNFDEGGVGASAELVHFVTDDLAFTLRHIGDYEDNGQDTSVNLTRLGFDWSTDGTRSQLVPFVGASLGAAYGESVNESGLTGVHVGIRFWQQPRAYLQAVAGYDRFWTRTEDETEYYRENVFTLVVAIGVVF